MKAAIGIWVVMACWFATNVWALDEDESFSSYDSIVSELKASVDEKPPQKQPDWAAVALHGGLGISTSYVNVRIPDLGVDSSGLLKGFQAHIGFNMFTRDARLELIFRNFAHDGLSNLMNGEMREIETTVVFLPVLRESTLLRMGAGVSERFMNVRVRFPNVEHQRSWATPYYSLLLGLEHRIAKAVSVGPDFTHHAPLDASSYSKSTWDASFRLNATF